MPFDPHANLASSLVTIAPSPDTSGTTLTVSAGQGALFPNPSPIPFNCTVVPWNTFPTQANSEIVRVTAIVGDTFTIIRAQEGTTAKPIAAGWLIANSITAKVITDIEAATGGGSGVTSVSGLAPIVSSGGTTPEISMPVATSSANGYLSSADWSTFNAKQPAGAYLTSVTSDSPLSGSGTSGSHLVIAQAGSGTSGYLSSTDWNTFNNKQAAGSYITALTGDVSASGPGSAAATLATVNSNVGSFGSSTAIPAVTVNAKGLVTAASTAAVVAPAGTLTGTDLATNVVNASLSSVTPAGGTLAVSGAFEATGAATLLAGEVLRSSDNTVSEVAAITFERGSGAGTDAVFYTRGDTSNGVSNVSLGFGATRHQWQGSAYTCPGILSAGGNISASGNVSATGSVNASSYVRVGTSTAGALPGAGSIAGAIFYVTDANATTRLSVVAGGGSNKVLVFSDGTNWLII